MISLRSVTIILAFGWGIFSCAMMTDIEAYENKLRLAHQKADKAKRESQKAKEELFYVKMEWRDRIYQLRQNNMILIDQLKEPYMQVERKIEVERREKRQAKL